MLVHTQPSPPSSKMDHRVYPKAALTPAQLWLLGVSELGVPAWGFEFCVILMIILPQAITHLNSLLITGVTSSKKGVYQSADSGDAGFLQGGRREGKEMTYE